jgi:hypothetical protein
MKKETVTKVLSVLLAVSGILLMVWWLLLGLTQWLGGAGDSLVKLVLISTWLPINIVGLLSTVLLILGLMGILTENILFGSVMMFSRYAPQLFTELPIFPTVQRR